jgi:hypothetical protein
VDDGIDTHDEVGCVCMGVAMRAEIIKRDETEQRRKAEIVPYPSLPLFLSLSLPLSPLYVLHVAYKHSIYIGRVSIVYGLIG